MSGHLSSSSLLPSLASSSFPHDLKSPLNHSFCFITKSFHLERGERKERKRKGRRGKEKKRKERDREELEDSNLNFKCEAAGDEPLFRNKTTASELDYFLPLSPSWLSILLTLSGALFFPRFIIPLDHPSISTSSRLRHFMSGSERKNRQNREKREIEEGRKSLDTFSSCVSKSRGRKKSRVEEAERMT